MHASTGCSGQPNRVAWSLTSAPLPPRAQLESPPLLESKNSENNSTANSIDLNAIKETLSEWEGHRDFVPTPSTPSPILEIHDNRDRPSPRFDSNLGDSIDFPHLSSGMAVSIGRIEHCPIMGIKLFALAHNTIRGAAGAAIIWNNSKIQLL